ncbi:hypothetical protein BASA83_013781 [Batrachochytrium salamandrivorans]|nr:hypothetical protein BASA83_013781 [Batrachochytrium salamandrivorans]
MPLDELRGWRKTRNLLQELRGSWSARSAANVRTKAQAEAMRKRNGFDKNTRIITSSWRYGENETPRPTKLEFNWKGPYHVVDVGPSRNLLDYDSAGSSTSKRCNQADLAPWLAPVIDNVDFFYDGTNRNSSLDS